MRKEDLDAYFNGLIAARLTDCLSVAVAYKGETAYAFCGADRARPAYAGFDETTRFNIGSVTKPVTAALLALLVERGLVSDTDKVQRYIPEYPLGSVSLYHLLTHSAGYDNADFAFPAPQNFDDQKRYLRDIYSVERLTAAPGEKAGYFSMGYTILMDVIERVSGQDIETFAQENLFRPLGMTETTYDTRKLSPQQTVMPYLKGEDRFLSLLSVPPTGDSGLYTTAADLLKFGLMFADAANGRGNRVFSAPAFRYMLAEFTHGRFHKTPVFWTKLDFDTYRCFAELSSPNTFGHTGFSGCMLSVDTDSDVAVAILTNSCWLHEDWSNYRRIINRVMSAL